MASRRHRLIEIEYPEFGESRLPPRPDEAELQGRLDRARAAMAARGLTHLVVYGDREHFANLAYLTGFDPRFEEAVLILSRERPPFILVGNECEGYLPVSPLFALRGIPDHPENRSLPLNSLNSNSNLDLNTLPR